VEYRLIVREDNTDERLAHYGRKFGLLTDAEFAAIEAKYALVRRLEQRLKEVSLTPGQLAPVLEAAGSAPAAQRCVLYDILKRPHVTYAQLAAFDSDLAAAPAAVAARVEYDIKYEGFITRQKKEVEKFRHLENIRIPPELDLAAVPGISHEVREKLKRVRPETLGQANRISGMTPAAISVLMIYLRKYFAQ
jgi:tRNA uridine 5-carboxymethylaminomethyl modification enzyme